MKSNFVKVALLTLAFLVSSGTVAATSFNPSTNPACKSNAAKEAEDFARGEGRDYYDKNGFSTTDCSVAPRGRAVVCEVSATKGDWAAGDTYIVIMNSVCTHAYRIELTGEE